MTKKYELALMSLITTLANRGPYPVITVDDFAALWARLAKKSAVDSSGGSEYRRTLDELMELGIVGMASRIRSGR